MIFTMFFIWIILFVSIVNFCLDMVSSANTIENIIGALGIGAAIVLSYKTKCLTAIKIKKNEK